ncbi:unnamed protein product [Soboliphyme baturini]|uniref:RPN1_RPN2_N domain-containing protein n=1 Tax=Soboliphyme baturini TaxID=241478 RepID=A0A183IYS2_9BILA|nr:unnamed protein product [Soboliphyme baturini]
MTIKENNKPDDEITELPAKAASSEQVEGKEKNGKRGKNDDKKESEAGKKKEEEESEEDKRLQEELNLLMERLQEDDQSLYNAALETLRTIIRSSTTSMTSVPKPLKYMRLHYDSMKAIFEKINDPSVKKFCADIISALAMTCSTEGSRECLKYRLLGSKEPISSWGHEYIRHLSAEIADEWKIFDEAEISNEKPDSKPKQILAIVEDIVPYYLSHNGEAEACDLIMELERLEMLHRFVDEETYGRVCLYILSCIPFVPDPENTELLCNTMHIYLKFSRKIEAVRVGIMLNDSEMVKCIFLNCEDIIIQKQIAFLLGRHQMFLDLPDDMPYQSDLSELMSNSNLSQYFLTLARELDIMEPKTPEDIYKQHLEPTKGFAAASQVDSARQNLASSFVNGFINAGFCVDKMIADDANKWFYKNKEHGMLSAAASQGLIYRWDMDNGLTQIDKFLYSNEDYIKAGSLLAVGIISSGIHHDCDPAQALLLDYVKSEKSIFKIGSILG